MNDNLLYKELREREDVLGRTIQDKKNLLRILDDISTGMEAWKILDDNADSHEVIEVNQTIIRGKVLGVNKELVQLRIKMEVVQQELIDTAERLGDSHVGRTHSG